jgi:hypothetical protein
MMRREYVVCVCALARARVRLCACGHLCASHACVRVREQECAVRGGITRPPFVRVHVHARID